MMTYVLGALAIAGYAAAAILQYFNLTRRDKSAQRGSALAEDYLAARRRVVAAGAIAWLLHTLSLYGTLFLAGRLQLDIANAGSLVGWLVAGLVLISSFKKPLENLFILIFPLAALTLLTALILLGGPAATQSLETPIAAHILLSLLAYSVLTIAAVQALLLAVQDHHLRHQHANGFVMQLPPLQTMEQLLFELIWVGFLFLTASILTGVVFIENIMAQHLAHKTVLSVVAWIIFFILLLGKHLLGWRGTTAIRFTLGGYSLLMLAYFGTKLVLEIILERTF